MRQEPITTAIINMQLCGCPCGCLGRTCHCNGCDHSQALLCVNARRLQPLAWFLPGVMRLCRRILSSLEEITHIHLTIEKYSSLSTMVTTTGGRRVKSPRCWCWWQLVLSRESGSTNRLILCLVVVMLITSLGYYANRMSHLGHE
jgi:hypothetical protein